MFGFIFTTVRLSAPSLHVVIACVLVSHAHASAPTVTAEAFREDAAAGWSRCEEELFSCHLEVVRKLTRYKGQAADPDRIDVNRELTLTFYTNPGKVAVDFGGALLLQNPDYIAKLTRPEPTADWQLGGVEAAPGPEAQIEPGRPDAVLTQAGAFWFGPASSWSFYSHPFSQFFDPEVSTITDVRRSSLNGEEAVVVDFDRKKTERLKPVQGAVATFLPQRNYALARLKYVDVAASGSRFEQERLLEYPADDPTTSIPRSVTLRTTGPEVLFLQEHDVRVLSAETPPDEVFRMSHYGLPEPSGAIFASPVGTNRSAAPAGSGGPAAPAAQPAQTAELPGAPWRLWLVLAAAVLFGGGALVKWWTVRRR